MSYLALEETGMVVKWKNSLDGTLFSFTVYVCIWQLQIPKGWDKLVVSIISVETGKTIAKSGKATARNGNCRWIETFSESIWIQPDDASKDIEEYHIKLIVSMV